MREAGDVTNAEDVQERIWFGDHEPLRSEGAGETVW